MEVFMGRAVRHQSPARISRRAPPRARLETAMREVHEDTPSTVTRAKVTGARKERMLRAIAYSKTRA